MKLIYELSSKNIEKMEVNFRIDFDPSWLYESSSVLIIEDIINNEYFAGKLHKLFFTSCYTQIKIKGPLSHLRNRSLSF